ncbi:sugar phosphate isomerase/epimerase [Ruficoccus sp. ZRK36]|uniref:sugar phosphate isomerase/epimerase family protein n=1 Tax=Ruficoccus sp. ZRK36 TaxID=2866311 RepID=UPI001C732C06|nr:sugar phosphate isomerase/epimerase [Ruficoccus sp. ZRK36]QYY35972.1 sugar phosphate isomerase/epimerase [Ruficoccus sp. ZRK36]
MKPQITVQLFSVRENAEKDYEGTIRAIADMGFGCVEPAGYPGSSPEKAAKLFAELGLQAPTAHIALPIGENKNAIIEQALLMGHKYLITGCPPGFKENYTSMDKVKAMTELYCEAAANAAPHGLQVGYHNHDWDLAVIDGESAYKYFLANTPESVLWEADLFWVAKAGLNPAEFVEEIGPRGLALHFKDGVVSDKDTFREAKTESGNVMLGDTAPFRPAGAGDVDLLSAAKVYKYTQYVAVELDRYDGDMMQAVKESYDYLTGQGIAQGKK